MEIRQRLDQAIEGWNLLNHPFYQAWSNGTLPTESLRKYAREYGTFIREIPLGWETAGDASVADEEREHFEMWQEFADALGTQVDQPESPEVEALVVQAREMFVDKTLCLGALYTFEAQQPGTALSKLEGLRTHYSFPESVEPYFEAHLKNDHETDALLASIESLPRSEQDRAIAACESMSRSLWDALTGVHGENC